MGAEIKDKLIGCWERMKEIGKLRIWRAVRTRERGNSVVRDMEWKVGRPLNPLQIPHHATGLKQHHKT